MGIATTTAIGVAPTPYGSNNNYNRSGNRNTNVSGNTVNVNNGGNRTNNVNANNGNRNNNVNANNNGNRGGNNNVNNPNRGNAQNNRPQQPNRPQQNTAAKPANSAYRGYGQQPRAELRAALSAITAPEETPGPTATADAQAWVRPAAAIAAEAGAGGDDRAARCGGLSNHPVRIGVTGTQECELARCLPETGEKS